MTSYSQSGPGLLLFRRPSYGITVSHSNKLYKFMIIPIFRNFKSCDRTQIMCESVQTMIQPVPDVVHNSDAVSGQNCLSTVTIPDVISKILKSCDQESI